MHCFVVLQLPTITAVGFSHDFTNSLTFDSCCTPFSDAGLSLIKGPVQNVRVKRSSDTHLLK